MDLQHYSQSFSQGQITIPKSFRDKLGLGSKFWFKMTLDQNKIILEPTQSQKNKAEYLQKLANLKTDWFDYQDYKKIRKEMTSRLTQYDHL